MPVKSYLVYPHEGQKDQLARELSKLPCELIPAENEKVIVMVSDTRGKEEEELFLDNLNKISSLDHCTLVSVFND